MFELIRIELKYNKERYINIMAKLNNTTINGTLTTTDISGGAPVNITGEVYFSNSAHATYEFKAGDKASLRCDSEGGNLTLKSPNNITYEIDAYNDNLRLYYYDKNLQGGTPITIDRPTGKIHFFNYTYGENKVIWSGDHVMTADQTITLLESISNQPHGIVLMWVGTDSNGKASLVDATYHFVPKYWVDGSGSSHPLTEGDYNKVGVKYLYISNSSIRGYKNNDKIDTTKSVDSSYWHLYRIIGI